MLPHLGLIQYHLFWFLTDRYCEGVGDGEQVAVLGTLLTLRLTQLELDVSVIASSGRVQVVQLRLQVNVLGRLRIQRIIHLNNTYTVIFNGSCL